MPRWEYQSLTLYWSAGDFEVRFVDGQKAGTTGFLGLGAEHPMLSEYLARAGDDGWEAAGFTSPGEGWWAYLILKREK